MNYFISVQSKMARFSVSSSLRFRIVALKRQGFKVGAIVKRLKEEKISLSRQTAHSIIKRFRESGTIAKKQRKGRPTKFRIKHMDFIDKSYEENDELTAADLQKKMFNTFGLDFSISTIKVIRKRLGWKQSGPRYCQLIRKVNCEKRLKFVQECLERRDTFDDVVFTDESSIIIDRHARVCFRKVGKLGRLKPKAKHPVKV